MHAKSIMRTAATVAVAAFALAALPGQAADYETNWDKIKRTGKIQIGCMIQVPYWQRDVANNWKGFGIEMAKDIAKELKVEWECVETSWGTAALGIQTGQIDTLWAMQATPLRATAITFAGPLYNHGFMTVNGKNFQGKTWEDYNKPGIRISVLAGTSNAEVLSLMAPKATKLEMKNSADVPLAVVSGRADTMLVTVINGVVAKARNPDLGAFVIPTPLVSLPAYAGVRNETDSRFRDFVHWWAEWNRLRGQVEKWIREALVEIGVPDGDLPEKLYF